MSFPRYPRYRTVASGLLGEMPEHWELVPLKWLTEPSRPIMYGIVLPGPDVGEGIPILKGGNVKPDRMRLDAMARTTPEIEAPYARARLKGGDLAYSIRGSIGDCEIVPPALLDANITQDVARVAVDPQFDARWVRWALLAAPIREDLASGSLGAAVRGINIFDLKRVVLPTPPRSEQTTIADLLDRETAKIDALVAEQERLIELLKEKRQAVISHAVTKGLNPAAPMKDSGIEWVGEVPAHWACIRNKAVFLEVDDRSDDASGELLTVSHITGVTRRSEKDVNMFMAETLEGYKKCCPGDLVINTMWAWMGALGCSPLDGLVSPSYNVYRPRNSSSLVPAYYDYLCRLPAHAIAMKSRSTGVWESRLRLYPGAFLDMRMPLPPREEQDEIVRYLDDQLRRWNDLIAEAERAISLLQERRAALISAAVTGQIDVRAAADRSAA